MHLRRVKKAMCSTVGWPKGTTLPHPLGRRLWQGSDKDGNAGAAQQMTDRLRSAADDANLNACAVQCFTKTRLRLYWQ